MLSLNLLFAYIIGLSIPQLETRNSYIFGLVMIPLLVILNYIILDRFHFYVKKLDNKENWQIIWFFDSLNKRMHNSEHKGHEHERCEAR